MRAGLYDDVSTRYLYEEAARGVAEGVDTYWIGKPVRTGVGQQHTLGLSGGDEQFRYNLSLAYNSNQGAMKGSFRNNFNGSLSISYLLKNLRFTNTVSLGLNNSEDSPYGTFSDYVKMNPYWSPRSTRSRIREEVRLPTRCTMPRCRVLTRRNTRISEISSGESGIFLKA